MLSYANIDTLGTFGVIPFDVSKIHQYSLFIPRIRIALQNYFAEDIVFFVALIKNLSKSNPFAKIINMRYALSS